MRALLLAILCLVVSGCGAQDTPPRAMPTWFSVGGDVYRFDEARAAQAGALSLGTYPRWFEGLPIDRADRPPDPPGTVRLEATVEGDPSRRVTAAMPLPDRLRGLPRTHLGAQLTLAARTLPSSEDLELTLTLRAGARPLWREIEHRCTNVAPFLIGLFADGRPVRVAHQGSGKFGGIRSFVRLVEPNTERTWVLRIRRASVRAHLGKPSPAKLELVAAFSERQHSGIALDALAGHVTPDVPDFEAPFEEQVLLRSNVATIDTSLPSR